MTRVDFGAWRRIKPVCFYSKFVPNPNPANPLEFPTDPEIKRHLQEWRGCFLALLIEYHNKGPLAEAPEEFQEVVRELQDKSDVYSRFVGESLVYDSSTFVDSLKLFQAFTGWAKDNGMRNAGTKQTFETNIADILGKAAVEKGIPGWRVALKSRSID